MNSTARGVIASIVVAVLLLGPLTPPATAQQPAPAGPPGEVVEVVTEGTVEAAPQPRQRDVYDVAAGVATVFKSGGNVVTCAVAGGFGIALFLVTFGSAYQASVRTFEEGCAQKWVVRGDDIRPKGAPGYWERPRQNRY